MMVVVVVVQWCGSGDNGGEDTGDEWCGGGDGGNVVMLVVVIQ